MTKQEFTSIMVYVNGAYNNFNVDNLVWYDMLKELNYQFCFQAVKNVIKVAKYPLSIAAIIEEYNKIIKNKQKEEIHYLLGVADRLLENGTLSSDLFEEIEYQIAYEDRISEKNKQILLRYNQGDKKMAEILKGKEIQLCLTNKS